MRWLLLGLAMASTGCDVRSVLDSGVDSGAEADTGIDPGFDIPPEEWIDAGFGGVWGCFGRSLDRFVVRMETQDRTSPWCAAVLFKRQDGGFTPLFPDFRSSEDFEIADARWALACDGLELPDGGLAHELTRPVHEFNGELNLVGYFMNRPRGLQMDAGLRLAYRVIRISRGGGLAETCQGP